jgi:AsmA protein
LHGAIDIDEFVLEKPVIALSVDKSGKPNWAFGAASAPATAPQAAAKPAAPSSGGGSSLSGLALGDVRIVDGQATYADAQSGKKYEINGINLKVSLPSMSSPMQADGSLVWNQEKVSLSLHVDNPDALMSGQSTGINASVSGNPVKLAFKGQMSNGKAIAARGDLDLDVPSIRKLAAWAGQPLQAPGTGFGPLKIAGSVDVAGAKYAFNKATLALDAIKGTGDFQFDGSGKKPYANARLAMGVVDVNPYLPPEKAGGAPAAPAASGGSAKSHEWSNERIDFSPLRAADADLDLSIDGLLVQKIKVGKSHLAMKLKDGKLVADLTDMELYKGHGKAKVTADDSQSVPAVALDFDLANFEANPFLTDAMDLKWLYGTANTNINVTGRGDSQRAIISALNGNGKVQFLNGAITGINLGAMVRNVGSAFTGGGQQQEKTDFAELGGTFTIKNGILTNNDLAMESPLLRVSGHGTVDLPKQSVNYRVEPKMVASLEGQGGKSNLAGITVPVIVEGPWDNISYHPDLAGMASGIAKAPGEALKGVEGGVGGLIPGQGGGSTSGTSSGSSSSPSVGNTLKGLFGK